MIALNIKLTEALVKGNVNKNHETNTDIIMPDKKTSMIFYTMYNLYKMPDSDAIKSLKEKTDIAYNNIEKALFNIFNNILDYPEPLDRDEKLMIEMIKSIPNAKMEKVMKYVQKNN